MTVVRVWKIRTALRTNQIAEFVTVTAWKKIRLVIIYCHPTFLQSHGLCTSYIHTVTWSLHILHSYSHMVSAHPTFIQSHGLCTSYIHTVTWSLHILHSYSHMVSAHPTFIQSHGFCTSYIHTVTWSLHILHSYSHMVSAHPTFIQSHGFCTILTYFTTNNSVSRSILVNSILESKPATGI